MARAKPRRHSGAGWLARLGALGLTAGLLAMGARGRAAGPAKGPAKGNIIPISEVRPGMKGYAVTVFEGTRTDRFAIEVVDVIKNYLPKQDAVLFRSTDPRLQHSGIVGGMSGSPIYLEGRLVGALSYGWRFNKDPLGALTPIGNMLEVGALPYRPNVLPHPHTGSWRGPRDGAQGWSDAMLGLQTEPLPPRRRPTDLDPATGLEPLGIPLTVSGLSAGPTRMLMEAFGLQPVRGGSGGSEPTQQAPSPRTWRPGDAASVVLIRGDSSVAGNGTVTWVSPKGDRLLAFGHSMFNDGPTNVPFAAARVHSILASVERSVKLSSPLAIEGLMYQDRQAAIALRTDLRAPMIPVHTEIQGPDPDLQPRTYDNEVAVGVNLTPNLVGVILAEAVDEAGHDTTEVVVHITHDISLETSQGPRDVHLEEEVFFAQGLSGRMMSGSRGVLLLSASLDNPFEVAHIRGVKHHIAMSYAAPVETIEMVRLSDAEVRAGDIARVEVVLRRYRGEEHTELVPIRIPDDAGGEELQVDIAGGGQVRPYRPIPANLDDLVTTIAQSYPPRSLVVSLYRSHEGLSTKHGLLPELPGSVLETLADQSSTRDAVRFKQLARRVIPGKTLIQGEHTLRFSVLPSKTPP